MQVLYISGVDQVIDFFYATLCLSMKEDSRLVFSSDDVGHKAMILADLGSYSRSDDEVEKDMTLTDMIQLGQDSGNPQDRFALECAGNVALIHTGFFGAHCRRQRRREDIARYTDLAIKAYHLASLLESDERRKKVLSNSALYFRVWQLELFRLEKYLRTELPVLATPIKLDNSRHNTVPM